jgi:hypothetical protein
MTVHTLHSIGEKRDSIGYAAVYVDSTESASPQCVPTKKRVRMIKQEMDEILGGAQDYLLRHMIDDDLSDEAKSSLFKAAMEMAYHKHYYNSIEHTVTYYPTCKDLVLNHNFVDEAEKFYYRQRDQFPPEYKRAVNSAARALERKRLIEDSQKNYHPYEEDESESTTTSFDDLLSPSMHVRTDLDMLNSFGQSWRDESLRDQVDKDDDTDDDDDVDDDFGLCTLHEE